MKLGGQGVKILWEEHTPTTRVSWNWAGYATVFILETAGRKAMRRKARDEKAGRLTKPEIAVLLYILLHFLRSGVDDLAELNHAV